MDRVYLDHAATTPLEPAVRDAMRPYWTEEFGNASSVHAPGRRARHAVEESRERVARCLGAAPGEIVFTSGGTEADNAALKGVSGAGGRRGLLTSAAEHRAVLEPAHRMRANGRFVRILTPEATGRIDPAAVEEALAEHEEIALASFMLVNNELGTLNPVAEIAAICRGHGVRIHCDAVQAPGVVPLDVEELGVDLLSISGHKLRGPKGVGVLYARGDLEIEPLVEGGGQERERRGGTENVPAVVGMAEALERATSATEERAERLRRLRGRLLATVRDGLEPDELLVNTPLAPAGGTEQAAAHVLNVAFPPGEDGPIDGEMLLLNMDMKGICVSSGSACSSGTVEPSHVLEAIGLEPATASAALRFSLGEDTTEEDVDRGAEALVEVLTRMRA